jgi:hypothetical protein
VRFVSPNPLAPEHYLVVQAATRPDAVRDGDRLAAFLPDWVVYDAAHLPDHRTNTPTTGVLAQGFFDDAWSL